MVSPRVFTAAVADIQEAINTAGQWYGQGQYVQADLAIDRAVAGCVAMHDLISSDVAQEIAMSRAMAEADTGRHVESGRYAELTPERITQTSQTTIDIRDTGELGERR